MEIIGLPGEREYIWLIELRIMVMVVFIHRLFLLPLSAMRMSMMFWLFKPLYEYAVDTVVYASTLPCILCSTWTVVVVTYRPTDDQQQSFLIPSGSLSFRKTDPITVT